MTKVAPLPADWIDRIFTKLSLTYGRAFMAQYEGLEPAAVKQDWAIELAGFQNSPEALGYGLRNLPIDRPPNVLQFRALCRKAPPPTFKALPSPPLTEEGRAKVKAMLDEVRRKIAVSKGA